MSLVGRGLLCLGSGETEAPVCSRGGTPADQASRGRGARTTRPFKVLWQLLDVGLLGSCLCLCVRNRQEPWLGLACAVWMVQGTPGYWPWNAQLGTALSRLGAACP